MQRSMRHLLRGSSVLFAAALVATACGGDDSSSESTTTTAAAAQGGDGSTTTAAQSTTTEAAEEDVELAEATLNASGATFPKAFYDEAIIEFADLQPNITINYAGGGSGKGRTDLQEQQVDFAGSDGLVKDEDRPNYKGGEFLYFPTVAAPITVSFNLDGVDELQLSADTIAKIFQAEITSWDDAAIKADNPDADLPATPITVARRSDGSGTTENFTKFLVSAAPDTWKLKSGSTVEWPANTQGAQGNAGVAALIQATNGAIGYVDFSDAKATGLAFASIKNKAGKFVEPSLEATSAALDTAEVNDDLSYNPINAPGEDAYPIAAPTWILVYKNQTDKAKGEATKAFLEYILTDGQALAPDIDYAPLPDGLDEKALAQLDEIVIPS
ncbi:MAG: phosphate ABC transporter substrate-binding protein PstS [Acidimicrobiia bacterium]